ncbi:MAG: hypothetical protein H7255_00670 [Ramlibacter sp.]|nr:hypothetical protein [Ramlibacter sp.]
MTVRTEAVSRVFFRAHPLEAAQSEARNDAPPPLGIGRPLALERSPALPLEAIGPGSQRIREQFLAQFEEVHIRARTYDAQLEWHRAQLNVPRMRIPERLREGIVDQLHLQDNARELMDERNNLCMLWADAAMAGPVPRYDRMGGDISQLAIRFGRMDDRVVRMNGPIGEPD